MSFRWAAGFTLLLCTLPLAARAAEPVLEAQWRSTAAAIPGHVGIAALVVETGQAATLNGGDRFPMQSVYKLPIAMAVMALVDKDTLSLNQSIEITAADLSPPGEYSPLRDRYPDGTTITLGAVMHYALVDSDNSASDVLLRLAGGPDSVTAFLRASGITDMTVADSEKDMVGDRQYRDWATPQATTALLATLLQDHSLLTRPSCRFLLELMHTTHTGDNRIRRLLPPGTEVEDKTGTSGTRDGLTAATTTPR